MEFKSYAAALDFVSRQENPDAWTIEQVPYGNKVQWQARNTARFG